MQTRMSFFQRVRVHARKGGLGGGVGWGGAGRGGAGRGGVGRGGAGRGGVGWVGCWGGCACMSMWDREAMTVTPEQTKGSTMESRVQLLTLD